MDDALVLSLKENVHAPRFNTEATDMLNDVFLKKVHDFQQKWLKRGKTGTNMQKNS
nr:hypothetical protein [Candidatus Sigynarchaeota archaeon]